MIGDAARATLPSLAIVALVAAGCAKRPALSQASAPAPSGAATESKPVAAAPPAPAPPAPAPAPAPVARPAPREFEAVAQGHCDERGTNEYNTALGDRRARATMTYLVGRGIAAARMTTTSYGEERPLCGEHAETCWSRNRRAQFLVKSAE